MGGINDDGRMPYSIVLVGDYIIGRGAGAFTQLQVIKLAFLCYGHVLAALGRKLFDDEIEAWVYGPMVPALRESLAKYGCGRITELQYSKTGFDSKDFGRQMDFIAGRFDPEVREILDIVIDQYGYLGGGWLLELTALPGTPWDKSYVRGQEHTVIPDGLIRRYYSKFHPDGAAGDVPS